SDLLFMVKALNRIDKVPYIKEAIYFYRRRNAPIKKPSLRQSSVKEKLSDFLSVYLYLKKEYSDPLVNYYLDKKLLNFYRKDIFALFNTTANIKADFEKLSTHATQTNHGRFDTHDYVFKQETRPLAQVNTRKYKRLFKRLTFLRDLNEGIKSRPGIRLFIYKD